MKINPISVLLADDDPAQLAYLSAMVRRLRPEWNIVSEATSSAQLQSDLQRLNPTLSILDVRFSEITSLEIIRGMHQSCPTIFVTGDPLFAVDAFTCDALDFVLKPIYSMRFEQALCKADAFIASKTSPSYLNRRVASSLRMLRGHDLVWTPVSEIYYFEAQRKYTRVVLKDQEGLVKMGISTVVPFLDSDRFLRIHRSSILNIAKMASAKRDEFGRLTVLLKERSEKLIVSKPYEQLFRDGFA